MTDTIHKLRNAAGQQGTGGVTYWRVEGSLLEVGAMRLVGFFTWNAQSFSERWARRKSRPAAWRPLRAASLPRASRSRSATHPVSACPSIWLDFPSYQQTIIGQAHAARRSRMFRTPDVP